MVDTKYVIDDILNAVVDEKPVDLQAALNSVMVDKAHDQITGMKAQLMQDMLGDEPDDEEPEEFEYDEDEFDGAEDDVEIEYDDEENLDTEDDDEELDADELFNDLEDEDETENQG